MKKKENIKLNSPRAPSVLFPSLAREGRRPLADVGVSQKKNK